MSDRITVSITDGVADVRLNRPEKMNALDGAMFAALNDTAASLAAESSVRAVVLSGEGRAFCAGLDLGSFGKMAEPNEDEQPADGALSEDEGRITHRGQQAVYGWTELGVPVIAAITGVALGGGIQLALGADIRIIAPDAKMSVLEIRWGLIPDMTGTRRLAEIVGLDVAKELVWSGRMVEGEEAVRIGLATQLADDPREAALAMARDIAGKSPDAIRASKRLLTLSRTADDAEGFAAERAEIKALIGSPNQVESVKASSRSAQRTTPTQPSSDNHPADHEQRSESCRLHRHPAQAPAGDGGPRRHARRVQPRWRPDRRRDLRDVDDRAADPGLRIVREKRGTGRRQSGHGRGRQDLRRRQHHPLFQSRQDQRRLL